MCTCTCGTQDSEPDRYLRFTRNPSPSQETRATGVYIRPFVPSIRYNFSANRIRDFVADSCEAFKDEKLFRIPRSLLYGQRQTDGHKYLYTLIHTYVYIHACVIYTGNFDLSRIYDIS